jgi:hypothetical protein
MKDKLILSLYDYTGAWAKPYIDAGYAVQLWDKKVEGCILENFSWLCSIIEECIENGMELYGVLAAPPCDDAAVSGSRWWKGKDAALGEIIDEYDNYRDPWNSVDYTKAFTLIVLHLINLYPPKFWVIENPVGRLEALVPELKPFRKMLFNPCDYGDPYTKKTILWGNFNSNLPRNPVEPEYVTYTKKNGKITRFAPHFGRTGGKSAKTKTIRSTTPRGFANAFFQANNHQLSLFAA